MKKRITMLLAATVGMGIGSVCGCHLSNNLKKAVNTENKTEKFRGYYNLLLAWFAMKQDEKPLTTFFQEKEYQKIAIYGMGELGTCLLKELKSTDISIICAIDKNAAAGYTGVDVKNVGERIGDVDVVIVTPIFAFDEIRQELLEYITCPIISLEDVIYGCIK